MRQIISFPCGSDILAGTLDAADGTTGLLIISGGNEIRSGTFAGQSDLARHVQALGYPVFRFDRRGVGDSEGANKGFEHTAEDIAAALAAFRAGAPKIRNIVGFGNCDGAAALELFPDTNEFSALFLTNPWTIDTASATDVASPINATAVRARYWARLKNLRSLYDLVSGRINLKTLAKGLLQVAMPVRLSRLATRIKLGLLGHDTPIIICLAARDATALAFMAAWKSRAFMPLRHKSNIMLMSHDTASHSFADPASRAWLYAQVEGLLKRQG